MAAEAGTKAVQAADQSGDIMHHEVAVDEPGDSCGREECSTVEQGGQRSTIAGSSQESAAPAGPEGGPVVDDAMGAGGADAGADSGQSGNTELKDAFDQSRFELWTGNDESRGTEHEAKEEVGESSLTEEAMDTLRQDRSRSPMGRSPTTSSAGASASSMTSASGGTRGLFVLIAYIGVALRYSERGVERGSWSQGRFHQRE